jgi:hypothetical protein
MPITACRCVDSGTKEVVQRVSFACIFRRSSSSLKSGAGVKEQECLIVEPLGWNTSQGRLTPRYPTSRKTCTLDF